MCFFQTKLENITVAFVDGPGHHSSLVTGTVEDFLDEAFC